MKVLRTASKHSSASSSNNWWQSSSAMRALTRNVTYQNPSSNTKGIRITISSRCRGSRSTVETQWSSRPWTKSTYHSDSKAERTTCHCSQRTLSTRRATLPISNNYTPRVSPHTDLECTQTRPTQTSWRSLREACPNSRCLLAWTTSRCKDKAWTPATFKTSMLGSARTPKASRTGCSSKSRETMPIWCRTWLSTGTSFRVITHPQPPSAINSNEVRIRRSSSKFMTTPCVDSAISTETA